MIPVMSPFIALFWSYFALTNVLYDGHFLGKECHYVACNNAQNQDRGDPMNSESKWFEVQPRRVRSHNLRR